MFLLIHKFKNWNLSNSAHTILTNQCLIEQAAPSDDAGTFPRCIMSLGAEGHDFEIPKNDFLTNTNLRIEISQIWSIRPNVGQSIRSPFTWFLQSCVELVPPMFYTCWYNNFIPVVLIPVCWDYTYCDVAIFYFSQKRIYGREIFISSLHRLIEKNIL